ncbi:MAG: hypothetical protein H7325_04745 [Pedobacter sp.]|nr:hypothetical protein [Pedobacter sp.]
MEKNEGQFENNVLLKIKRQFTNDEAINFLKTELQKAQFKNGELLSEKEELIHQNELLEKKIRNLEQQLQQPRFKLTNEDMKEQRIKEISDKIERKAAEVRKLQADVNLWRTKWLSTQL